MSRVPAPPEAPAPAAPPVRPAILALAALGVTCLAYAGGLGGDLVWDDHLLVEQPLVQRLQAPWRYLQAPFFPEQLARDHGAYYRPLVLLSLAVDQARGGGAPLPFHLTNLAAHLAAVLAVFLLARRLGAPGTGAALLAAAAGTLPRSSEAVQWACGRTDLFAGGLVLAALLVQPQEAGRPARRVGVAALLGLALLAKEVALAGVLAVLLLEWRARAARGAPLAAGWGAWLLPLAPVLPWAVLRAQVTSLPEVPLPLLERTVRPLETLGRYAAMAVEAFRPRLVHPAAGPLEPGWVVLGAAVLVAGAAGLTLGWRRLRPLQVALLGLAAASLGLVVGVVPLGTPAPVADRYLYLPALALAAAAGAWWPTRWPRAAGAAAAALVLAFAAATARRVETWSSELGLWRATIAEVADDEGLPRLELGTALLQRHREREAVEAFDAALAAESLAARRGKPTQPQRALSASVQRALALERLGEVDAALAALRALTAAHPEELPLRLDVALVLLGAERLDEAARELDGLPPGPAVEEVRQRLARARAEVAALPPPAPGEALELAVQRARVRSGLQAVAGARRAWRAVVEHPAATPAAVEEAARWFLAEGPAAEAGRAAVRLKALDPAAPALGPLEAAVAAAARAEE